MQSVDNRPSTRIRSILVQQRNLIVYAMIGAGAVAIDLGVFIVAHEVFDVPALVAHSVSVACAVIMSFLMNAFFNFKTTDRLFARFVSFATVSFIGYLVGSAVIIGLTVAGLGGTVSKIASLPLVFVTQYILNSRYSFRSTT